MATLDAFNRVITHHTVTIDSHDKSQCIFPVPTMLELAPMIKAVEGMKHTYEKGDVVLTLQDVKFFQPAKDKAPTHLCLLINVVDKNGSTTVLKNITTDERTEISPNHEEGEGYEVSSHIIIALNGKMRTYDMSYMPIPGVSTARINGFLDRVLFEVARKK